MIRTAIRAACPLALVLATAMFSPGTAAAAEPKDIVAAIYTEPSLALNAGKSAGYFARDLDAAMTARTRRGSGPVDFDYRYGAQDLNISGLEILQEIDNDQARVVAVFKNHGRANSVDWSMCRRPDGEWRIADASSNTGEVEWDLRRMMNLPDRIRC